MLGPWKTCPKQARLLQRCHGGDDWSTNGGDMGRMSLLEMGSKLTAEALSWTDSYVTQWSRFWSPGLANGTKLNYYYRKLHLIPFVGLSDLKILAMAAPAQSEDDFLRANPIHVRVNIRCVPKTVLPYPSVWISMERMCSAWLPLQYL